MDYLIDGTGNACALQINPIVPFMASRKDIVVTDSDWNEGALAPNGSIIKFIERLKHQLRYT